MLKIHLRLQLSTLNGSLSPQSPCRLPHNVLSWIRHWLISNQRYNYIPEVVWRTMRVMIKRYKIPIRKEPFKIGFGVFY